MLYVWNHWIWQIDAEEEKQGVTDFFLHQQANNMVKSMDEKRVRFYFTGLKLEEWLTPLLFKSKLDRVNLSHRTKPSLSLGIILLLYLGYESVMY